MNERINNITEISNQIFALLKNHDSIQHDVAVSIRYQLELIKEELVNINYAIHWAKVGIVNSYIFSNIEMKIIKEIFEKDEIPFSNVEESFEFANVKIASNNSMILYLIDIPLTDENVCESLPIRALKKGNKIFKINFEKILVCKDNIFGIKNNCVKHNEIKMCTKKNIVDISSSSCIPHLLKSHPPTCILINNQHIPTVEEIFADVILLNQYEGIVHIDQEDVNLSGSFVLQYHNSTITIDNQTYLSFEVSGSKPLPAILQSSAIETAEEEILNLEMMKELHLKNIKNLQNLKSKGLTASLANFGISGTILIIMAVLAIRLKLKKKSKLTNKYILNIENNIPLQEVIPEHHEEPEPLPRMDQSIHHHVQTNEDVRF